MSTKRKSNLKNGNDAKNRKVMDPKTKCGDIGIIEFVSLFNFMCHDNLEIKLEPNINFIIGQNGSGKSAILIAIILALGGRSSVTGRYPNIKGFVKTGKQKAKIELVLKNGGNHAYKPELYGSKITVIREITIDGVSTYKLKSSSGKIVSTSKEELKNILCAMDIQIENPVSVLTQETSRSFLTACKPDKLYQFFYQGSGLEKLEKSYCQIRIMKDETIAELKRKKDMLPRMEEDLKQWEKILKTADKIFEYKHELLWANVIEMERQVKEKEKELAKAQSELASKKQNHDNCKEKLSSATSNLNELEKRKSECDVCMVEFRTKMNHSKAECEKYNTEYMKSEAKLNASRRLEETGLHDMSCIKNNIHEILTKTQTDLNEDKLLRENEIKALKEERAKFDQDQKELARQQTEKRDKQIELKHEHDKIPSEIGREKISLQRQEEELERFKSSIQNRLNVFGHQTQNILNEIQRQSSQFSKLPKGPIGAFLEVKDERWGPAVETCIKPNLLRAFCCDNNKDSLILRAILSKFYRQRLPTILISKYASSMYDISKYRVRCQFPTVFDMLTIHDPVIANILIDNVRIESQILIEDVDTAISFMQPPPNNCIRAILMDCGTIELRPFRLYSSEYRSQGCSLSTVRKGEIEKVQQNINATKDNIKNLHSKSRILKSQINQTSQELKDIEKSILDCRLRTKGISRKIEELQIVEEPKSRHDMQESLDALEKELEKIKKVKLEHEMKTKEYGSKREDEQKQINLLSESLKKENKRYNELLVDLSKCNQDKETYTILVNKATAEIKALETKLEPLKNEVEKCQEAVKMAVKHAEKVCPRIDTNRSAETLARIISETEKIVETQGDCSREELLSKYEGKKKLLETARKKLFEKENNIGIIDTMYNVRQQGFKSIFRSTQSCIRLSFITFLKDDYDADATFDPKAKHLTLEVRPNKNDSKVKHRGGKCISLSGGERSYVTIAFLLAMWDRIKTPFKILDEYDVFMDSNNRKLSIDLLIFQAKQMLETQFIFLSPLDLPPMEETPLIKIHQMPPPKRVEPSST